MKHSLFHSCVRRIAPVLVAVAAMFSAAHTVSACPTCSDAVAANDPEHEHMVKGYFYSILFMMGVPYTVFMCFAGYMYWEVKKARARNATQVPGAVSTNPKKPLAPAAAAAEIPPPDVPSHESAETHELVEA
jgi:hypothetical protein